MILEKVKELSFMLEKLSEKEELSATELDDLEYYAYHAVLSNFKKWSKEKFLQERSTEVFPRFYTRSFTLDRKGMDLVLELLFLYMRATSNLVKRKKLTLPRKQGQQFLTLAEKIHPELQSPPPQPKPPKKERKKENSAQDKANLFRNLMESVENELDATIRERIGEYIPSSEIENLSEDVKEIVENKLNLFFKPFDIVKKDKT
jgi:hypothetical protein